MKLYHAAVFTNDFLGGIRPRGSFVKMNDHEREVLASIPNILESYHYINKQRYVDDIRKVGRRVFLDSGAFSAHSLGAEIDLEAYCRYVKENDDIVLVDDGVKMISVLDGIGDALKTWQNQQRMERLGVKPIPCFHLGEDPRYLEWYINNYEYLALGGMAKASRDDVIRWLDNIWSKYLLDGSGRARIRTHAFGVTTVSVMERYPWHSVDSSSWIQYAVFGHIYTTKHGFFTVSAKSPNRHEAGKHINTLTPLEHTYLADYITSRGFDIDRLQNVYEARAAFNCLSYIHLEQEINAAMAARERLACHEIQHLFG